MRVPFKPLLPLTMSQHAVLDFESAPVASTGLPTAKDKDHDLKDTILSPPTDQVVVAAAADLDEGALGAPTEHDMSTLRRISAPMP